MGEGFWFFELGVYAIIAVESFVGFLLNCGSVTFNG